MKINVEAVINAYKIMSESDKANFRNETGLATDAFVCAHIPKKKTIRVASSLLLDSTVVSSVAKKPKRSCAYCVGQVAASHTTSNCRNFTMDGQNKHQMKAMQKLMAIENAKIKRAYKDLGIQHLYDEDVNYALENLLTWNDIFLATQALADHGYVNGVHYERVSLPNEGHLNILY